MAILTRLKSNKKISDNDKIARFLKEFGIFYKTWSPAVEFKSSDPHDKILSAFEHEIKPIMKEKGFQTADIISINEKTPNIEEVRKKFLSEHTHSEDEVRFFVDGEGVFFFNMEEEVVSIHCVKGDFLSVPKGFKHWFDLAPAYQVVAIRLFTGKKGWVANYTGSKIEENY
jgi:1,2-dihydroxy-3-keto-5-methylthiopentene dioxygenase